MGDGTTARAGTDRCIPALDLARPTPSSEFRFVSARLRALASDQQLKIIRMRTTAIFGRL
jgi:hypothetical protein